MIILVRARDGFFFFRGNASRDPAPRRVAFKFPSEHSSVFNETRVLLPRRAMSNIVQLLGLRLDDKTLEDKTLEDKTVTEKKNECYEELKLHDHIQTYSGTYEPKTTNMESYDFEHYYIAERKNDAAEKFLAELNEHNNISDNATLGNEFNDKNLEGVEVVKPNSKVDTAGDFLKIKTVANMSAGFCKGNTLYHWKPPDGSYLEKNIFEVQADDEKSGMVRRVLIRLHARYISLKEKQRWVGWYYLFRLALLGYRSVEVYTVKDAEGNEARIPIVRHMPDLTIQHTEGYQNTPRPLFKQSEKGSVSGFQQYANAEQIDLRRHCQSTACTTGSAFGRAAAYAKLLDESYHYDVERLEAYEKFNEWYTKSALSTDEESSCFHYVYGITP